MRLRRLARSAIVLKPSTLLNLDRPLTTRKYQRAFSSNMPAKPGPKGPTPEYLSSDHDPLFRFHQWQANLRILDVKEF